MHDSTCVSLQVYISKNWGDLILHSNVTHCKYIVDGFYATPAAFTLTLFLADGQRKKKKQLGVQA